MRHHGRALDVQPEQIGGAPVVWGDPPKWLPPTLHALGYKGYLLLWLGQVTNSLALWMDMVARPALVLAMTGSAVQLGLIALVRGAPMLALAPFAGLLADRVDRRLLILISKTLGFLTYAVLAVVILMGQVELWHVYTTAIVRGVTAAFDQPARQALLPNLVPTRLLMNAIALNTGSMQLTRILSASVAGFAIAFWAVFLGIEGNDTRSFGGVYILATVAGLIAVVVSYLLKVPLAAKVSRTEASWFGSFTDGLKFVAKNPVVLGVLILMNVQSFFGLSYTQVFLPWLALEVMHIGPQGMGLLIGTAGLGSLVGAVAIATIGERLRRRGPIIIVGLTVYGLALVGLGLTSLLPPMAVLGAAVPVLPIVMTMLVGAGQTSIVTIKNAVLMEETPNDLRGRVFSIQSLDRGFSTLGAGAAGFLIAAITGPIALVIYGLACAVGAVTVGVTLPKLRKVD